MKRKSINIVTAVCAAFVVAYFIYYHYAIADYNYLSPLPTNISPTSNPTGTCTPTPSATPSATETPTVTVTATPTAGQSGTTQIGTAASANNMPIAPPNTGR